MEYNNRAKLAFQRSGAAPLTVLSSCGDQLGAKFWFPQQATPAAWTKNPPKWGPRGYNWGWKRWVRDLRWWRKSCSLTSWTNAARSKRLENFFPVERKRETIKIRLDAFKFKMANLENKFKRRQDIYAPRVFLCHWQRVVCISTCTVYRGDRVSRYLKNDFRSHNMPVPDWELTAILWCFFKLSLTF